jgi:hypothetical protein
MNRDHPTIRAIQEFLIICHSLTTSAKQVRPASAWRLESASHQMLHFSVHAHTRTSKKARTWRIERCITIAACARRCINRIAKVEQHRVMCSACLEMLDRVVGELEKERQHYEEAS